MNHARLLRVFAHWRTWWDLGSLAFAVCLLGVTFGSSVPPTVLGRPTDGLARFAVRAGFLGSILFFSVGFARLWWRQRARAE